MGKPMQQLNKFRGFLKTLPVGRILGENETDHPNDSTIHK